MNFLPLLEAGAGANPSASGTLITTVLYLVVLGGFMYLVIFRPQRKQQKEAKAMLETVQNGDSVLTTSGFYGVIIDVMDDVVIVEFGSNKNCRFPMKKTAIVQVEKPEGTSE